MEQRRAMSIGALDHFCSLSGVAAERFVELNRLPPDREGTEHPGVVAPHCIITSVPPAVSWLDAQTKPRPCQIDTDALTRCELELVLTDWVGQADSTQGGDQVELESALRRSILFESGLQPPFHPQCAVLALSSVVPEVHRCRGGRDQSQVPAVLGGALESVVVQASSEVVQHAVWFGHDGSTGQPASVTSSVV